MTPSEKMVKARAGLILDAPFFGSLALRLDMKADPSCETLWTDGRSLGFNPAFVEGLTLDEVKGLIAHEVMHLANCHHTRRKGRDHDTWNSAGDFAINSILAESKMVLPAGAYRDATFDGKSADEIYSALSRRPEPGGPPDAPPPPAPDAEPGDGPPEDAPGDEPGNEPGDEDGDGDGPPEDSGGPPDSGDAPGPSGGPPAPGGDPGGCGEVRDLPGDDGQAPSESDLTQEEQEWKIAAVQAATMAKTRGMLPGGLARMVQEIVNPKLDWRTILRRFIEMSAKNDYTWSPPNRRFIHQGLYMPSLRSEELKEIAIAVDTSCSIGQVELDLFASEINSILEEFDTVATVIYCDAQVNGVEVFARDDLPLELKPLGGGGTDFRPPFEYLEREQIEPTCLVYLTDLECSDFPDAPEYPVLWVQIGTGGYAPPFGEVAELAA